MDYTDKIMIAFENLIRRLKDFIRIYHIEHLKNKGLFWSISLISLSALFILFLVGNYWSLEPNQIDIEENAKLQLNKVIKKFQPLSKENNQLVTGVTTTATLISVSELLLEKPGGFLRNDISPPGLWLDNMPNWEFGVLKQLEDFF